MSEGARRRSGIPEVVPSALSRLPGRVGEVAAGTAERLRQRRFIGLAAEIAFFVAAGLAPLAVASMALLGGIEPLLSEDAGTRIDGVFVAAVMDVFGGDVAATAFADTQRLLNAGASGMLVPLTVGLFFSARGFTGAMRGLGHLYGEAGERPIWRDAVATLLFTLGAALLGALGALGALLSPLGAADDALNVFSWIRWFVLAAGLLVWLMTLYHYCRGPQSEPWPAEFPGAAVATAIILGAGLLYGLYLRSTPGLGIGPFIGAVVGVVLATFSLLFAYAAAVVIGGAVNAELSDDAR